MTYNEYISLISETKELESLLCEIPVENAIDRMGLEARLAAVQREVAGFDISLLPERVCLTFKGRPVFGSHGIIADFAGKAASSFADAFSAVVAEMRGELYYKGPIPNKDKSQLTIIGTALGSFGFEFELPSPEKPEDNSQGTLLPFGNEVAERAIEKIEALFSAAAKGSDDDVAALIEEIHPRAVKKTAEFLDFLATHGAWCGLGFKNNTFKFCNLDEITSSSKRLSTENVRENESRFIGEIQGALPTGRTFEFKIEDEKNVLKGKVGAAVENPDILNLEFLHKKSEIILQTVQVGKGAPRYTLKCVENIKLIPSQS